MARTGRRTQPRKRKGLTIGIGVAGLVVAIVALALLALNPAAPPERTTEGPALGAATAPILVEYFGDFQCGHCRDFELTAFDELRRSYIESGDVRLVFRNFPIVGPDSQTAAEASAFVWNASPDNYWEWHRAMFENQSKPQDGWASIDNLVTLSTPFVDPDALRAALSDDRFAPEVEVDVAEGRALGVNSTPTLAINGRLVNALDGPAVREAIDTALRSAG